MPDGQIFLQDKFMIINLWNERSERTDVKQLWWALIERTLTAMKHYSSNFSHIRKKKLIVRCGRTESANTYECDAVVEGVRVGLGTAFGDRPLQSCATPQTLRTDNN